MTTDELLICVVIILQLIIIFDVKAIIKEAKRKRHLKRRKR